MLPHEDGITRPDSIVMSSDFYVVKRGKRNKNSIEPYTQDSLAIIFNMKSYFRTDHIIPSLREQRDKNHHTITPSNN